MKILIIGGTRNIGHFLTQALLEGGHNVTVANRGRTADELPPSVERLKVDRTHGDELRHALAGRTFDAVVDNVIYRGDEAQAIIDLLHGRIGHYLFLSSGQVYLVREGAERPFKESDYNGRLMPAPKINTFAYEEWQYGMEKRQVEDVMQVAWQERQFPYTSLRIPMVNSERDHFQRLYSYVLRLRDGGPILVPETPDYPLRHVYGRDVARAIRQIIEQGSGKGAAYNVSQDETVTLDQFLALMGEILGTQPHLLRVRRSSLEADGFLPNCSPFSERWMSELDNSLGKQQLGLRYTPLADYLRAILQDVQTYPPQNRKGYARRQAELNFATHSQPPAK
jgi:nucleoside-diphosphate-sugar epimerase